MKKENIKYILLFVTFTIIFFLSPISGDDWGNYLEGSQGLKHMIGNAIGMYFDWEGRFVSRLLINFFTYYKPIWNIVNAMVIVGIIYYIVKIINPKHKSRTFLLTTLLILWMNLFTFSQVVVWIAGNITYLFVIPLLLYYFYQIINKKEDNHKIVLSILAFILPMFVEHMGVVLVFGTLLVLINDYRTTRKWNQNLIRYLVLATIGLLLMVLSPGSRKRSSMENLTFNELSILGKIGYNIPNLIYYTYIINPYLIILMSIGSIYLIRKLVKKRPARVLSYLYLIPLPIMITVMYLILSLKKEDIFFQNNNLLILYFISNTIFHFILLYLYTKKKEQKTELFFFLIGITANLVMLISPTWGYRTSIGTYLFLSIPYLIIIDQEMKKRKWITMITSGAVCLSIIYYFILYISVARQYQENYQWIEKQKKEGVKEIEIVKYPSFVNCNINPENDYHIGKFKKYYKIRDDVKIKLIDNRWKYLIFYQ